MGNLEPRRGKSNSGKKCGIPFKYDLGYSVTNTNESNLLLYWIGTTPLVGN